MNKITFQSVQFTQLCPTLCNPTDCTTPDLPVITSSWSLPKLMSIESLMPSNHLIPYCPLLLVPSIILSIRILSNESALCFRWPKNWSFSFNISPSNEHSGLISFGMDWLCFSLILFFIDNLFFPQIINLFIYSLIYF